MIPIANSVVPPHHRIYKAHSALTIAWLTNQKVFIDKITAQASSALFAASFPELEIEKRGTGNELVFFFFAW